MRTLITALMLTASFVPQQAFAVLKIINRSAETQRVIYSQAGSETTKAIAPGDFVKFYGSEGMLAIDTGFQKKAKADQAKSGVLSGIFGNISANTRTQNIPAHQDDVFVIWPDGRLLFQYRQRQNGGAN